MNEQGELKHGCNSLVEEVVTELQCVEISV